MKKLLILALSATILLAQNLKKDSIVKVYSSLFVPNYKQPWQIPTRKSISGSGVIIKDNYIITNAHVVSYSKFTQVSKGNDSKKYTASIEYISNQADLALLKVNDKKFYENTAPLKFTENVKTGDSVTVLGYPLGGNNLSATRGIVSRIETTKYVWSYRNMVAIQVDAAINSGNSGGPVLDSKNNIIGISMQTYLKDKADNIGYIIPSFIVKTFLDDIKDGKMDGLESDDLSVQRLINPTIKEYYNIKNNQGVLVNKIGKKENILKLGDIILEIEGHKVSSEGKVNTKYGLQWLGYFMNRKPIGKTIDLKIKRGNKILNTKYTLKKGYNIIQWEYSKNPRYIIFGGLVFAPLSDNYLSAKKLYKYQLFKTFYELKDKSQDITEGVIIQEKKFDNSANEGYYPGVHLIHSVNGVKVKNFKHFVKLLDKSNKKYTIIDFIDLNYDKIILDTKKAKASFKEIKNTYGLRTDRRIK